MADKVDLAKLRLMLFHVSWLKTFTQAVHLELLSFQAVGTAAEAKRDQNLEPISTDAQKRHHVKELLGHVRRHSHDTLWLLQSPQDMLPYCFGYALIYYLRPYFDAGRRHTGPFCSASTNQVKTDAKTFCEGASSSISFFNLCFSSLAVGCSSGSTTLNMDPTFHLSSRLWLIKLVVDWLQ